VCVAVALLLSELPTTLADGLVAAGRVHARCDDREARFY
jgi:hypothetical protein